MSNITPLQYYELEQILINNRGYLETSVEFHDEFLNVLVEQRVIIDEERYRIFVTPSPTQYRKLRRLVVICDTIAEIHSLSLSISESQSIEVFGKYLNIST